MADENRINYVLQLNAFREIKLNTSGLTAGMISVYYALLDMNNQCKWSEEFDVDFGYMMALAKVDKTTYYKAMEFFIENGIISKYIKGLNAYTRAKVSLCLLYDKSTGNTPSKENVSIINAPAKQVPDPHYIKTLKDKTQKENINILFEEFWIIYDKKTGKDQALKKWHVLTDSDREEILKVVPAYVNSKPDKKYRKDPSTYLNGGHWKDEIIIDTQATIQGLTTNTIFKLGTKPLSSVRH